MNEKTYAGPIERLRATERVQRLEVNRVVRLCLDNCDIKNILDVGTGSGIFAEAFSKCGHRVTGIDINADMLDAANQFVPEATFQIGSMENIPFDDHAFDLVFLGHVLHETETLDKAMAEIRRVTQKRTAVLEWPYKEEENGPPLARRLKPEQIHISADKAGYTSIFRHMLSYMELWILQ